MTGFTDELLVFSFQLIVGLSVVIEGPQQPVVGVVALAALLTHAPLMLIIRLMAGEAFNIRILELSTQMTGFTGGNAVNSYERKTGNIVFKKYPLVPCVFIVAIAAILALLALVHIDSPVAIDTLDVA